MSRTVKDGRDLIAVFAGKGNGFAEHSFAGKLLGRTSKGRLLFGYCRLPWVNYREPILSARRPQVSGQTAGGPVLTVEVSNHGQWASRPAQIQIKADSIAPVTASCPALQPYSKVNVNVKLPASFKSGRAYDLTVATGAHLQRPMVFTTQKVKIP